MVVIFFITVFPSASQFDCEKRRKRVKVLKEVGPVRSSKRTWFFAVQASTGKWDLGSTFSFKPIVGMKVPFPEKNGLVGEGWVVVLVVTNRKTKLVLEALDSLDQINGLLPGGVTSEILPAVVSLVRACLVVDRQGIALEVTVESLPQISGVGSQTLLLPPARQLVAVGQTGRQS